MFNNLRQKLLGSKGESPPTTLAVSIYGKLPIYKDYIQVGCNEKRTAEFKHWLEEAFGQPYEIFDGRTVPIEKPHKIIFSLSDGKSLVIATIWPSTDEGGLRKFPFSTFAVLPRSMFDGQSLIELWPALQSVWSQFTNLYEQAKSQQDITALYEKFKETQVNFELDIEATPPEPLNFQTWINAYEPDIPQLYADSLTKNIRKFIEIYRELESEGYAPSVRMPLAPDTSIPLQTDVWLNSFATALKHCRRFPTLIVPYETPCALDFVCMIWREMRNEDGFLFASRPVEYEYIDDLDVNLLTHDDLPRVDLGMSPDDWVALLSKP